LSFRTFADTRIALTDVLWTGKRFLYVENTTNEIFTSGAKGKRIQRFASLPDVVEETRCRLSPASHGFPRGYIYCHSPDGKIYRLSADGKRVVLFASLPTPTATDGALAFDTIGRFGYRMLAATGRSGEPVANGGTVYAVDAAGRTMRIGDYPGPGAADQVAIAPRTFGTASGKLLLTVDAGPQGTVQAMDAKGRVQTLAELPDGPNPIVVVPRTRSPRRANAPPPGLYVTDTFAHTVKFAPAASFASFRGQVVVGSEGKALFWVLRPSGAGFALVALATNFTGAHNLESADYVG
jgi:hypothetical protein